MRLTKEEKAICKKFRKRDENNIVHCYECPLVISLRDCLCKANAKDDEVKEGLKKNLNKKCKT